MRSAPAPLNSAMRKSGAPLERDDQLTLAAIAVAAMCIVTADHEAIGHGSACLMLGGQIIKLTSVYFACTVKGGVVAGAGPLGNLIGAAIAWRLFRATPSRLPRLRLLLLLITAFAVFWEAGYLLKAMIAADGDSYFAAQAALGAPQLWWRVAGCLLGVALYGVGIRFVQSAARGLAQNTLLICWGAATLAAVIAAALYAPDRMDAMKQAALEIGVASLPLVLLQRRMPSHDPQMAWPITRNLSWLAGCAILCVAFAATLGRGLA